MVLGQSQMFPNPMGGAGAGPAPIEGSDVGGKNGANKNGPSGHEPGEGPERGAAGPGSGRLYGQRPIGGLTEKIEGCFDRFDSEYAVELGRDHINNRRCQAICTERGYALSATGLVDSCFCGNDYPSVFHRVDTGQCDMPCSPDKTSCFAFTCCGSRDERFFTVSWSGEMDVLKQLLRQLSHDYRFNSPTFQRKIEGNGFNDRISLRLGPSPVRGGDEREELQEGEEGQWGSDQGVPAPPLFLSVGDGCPVGWTLFDCWCYKQHWAEPSTYDEAVAKCQAEPGSCGAELVTVTSEAENCFLRQMAGGCQGWLGYHTPPPPQAHDQGPDVTMIKALPPIFGLNDVEMVKAPPPTFGLDRVLWPTKPLLGAGLRERLVNATQSLRWRDRQVNSQGVNARNKGSRSQTRHPQQPRTPLPSAAAGGAAAGTGAAVAAAATTTAIKALASLRRSHWVPPRFENWQGQHNGTGGAKGQAYEGEHILRTGVVGLLNSSIGLGWERHDDGDDSIHAVPRGHHPIAELAFNYVLLRPHRRESARLAQIGMDYDDVGIRSLRLLYAPAQKEKRWAQWHRYHHGFHAAEPLFMAGRGDGSEASNDDDDDDDDDSSTGGAAERGKLKRAAVRLKPNECVVGVKAVIGVLGIRALTWITSAGEKEMVHGPYGAHLLLDRPSMLVRELRFDDGRGGEEDGEEEEDRGVVGVFGHRDAATGYIRALGFYQRVPSNCAWMAANGNWTMIDCARPHPSRHAPPGTSYYVCKKPGWPVHLGACEDGWTPFGEACYLLERAANTSWWDARRRCQRLGGHLVSVASRAENHFVHALLGPRGGYIGYRRPTTARPWRWDTYWNMNAVEAQVDGGDAEQCFEMRGNDGTWQRTPCRVAQPCVVLCEVGAANSSCICPQPRNATEEAGPGFWYAFSCSCYLRWVPGSAHHDTAGTASTWRISWVEAQAFCGRMGGRLLTIDSREENEWAHSLVGQSFTFNQGVMPAYVGLNNLMNGGDDYEWTYYENWRRQRRRRQPKASPASSTVKALQTATTMTVAMGQPAEQDGFVVSMCTQMDRDGKWVEVLCDEYGNPPKASCFICKQPRAATYPALRPHADECWFVDVVNDTTRGTSDPPPYPWCNDCSEAYLQSDRNGQFLCADAQNWLYLSWARDPAWCLWTLLVHPETGALVLLTRHNAALFYDAAAGVLACRNLPPEVNMQARYGRRDHYYHWWHHDPHNNGNGRHEEQQQQPPPPPEPTPLPWDESPLPDEDESPWEWEQSIFMLDDVAVLYPSHPVGKLAWRHLRISILARSRDLEQPGLKECSIAVYDETPRTNSYRCWRRPYSGTDDLVYLEQEALLFFDQSSFATPRVPLPNGRVRCENQSPTETATCTFAYGQGLTLSRQFRANWGYTISDVITHRVNVNPAQSAVFSIPAKQQKQRKQFKSRKPKKPPRTPWQEKRQRKRQQRLDRLRQHKGNKTKALMSGPDLTLSISELKEFQNAFSVAYNNFYEILIVKSYVETRNWQLSVPVAPRTTDTIQFWLSAENLRYRWRALFAARGGLTLTVWGQPIGDHHSLGDVSYFRDLFFFVFGTYEFPYEAEIIITVNDVPGEGWPLPLPEQSQGDRIRDVTRNGQLGFGYGPARPFY